MNSVCIDFDRSGDALITNTRGLHGYRQTKINLDLEERWLKSPKSKVSAVYRNVLKLTLGQKPFIDELKNWEQK